MVTKLKNLLMIVAIFLISATTIFAGTDPTYKSMIKGSDGGLKKEAKISLLDYNFRAFKEKIKKTISIEDAVNLTIDPTSPFRIESSFNATVDVTIVAKDAEGAETKYQHKLNVSYTSLDDSKKELQQENAKKIENDNPSNQLITLKPYKEKDFFVFKDAVEFEVIVNDIETNVKWDVTKVLNLSAQMTALRDYEASCATVDFEFIKTTTDATIANANGWWTINWSLKGPVSIDEYADEVDLEWTFIEERDISPTVTLSSTVNSGNVASFFINGSTRITTSSSMFDIPLLYDGKGFILVRLRKATNHISTGHRIEGQWEYSFFGSSSTGLALLNFNGHNNNLNWQATTTFAEEGKLKSVVQYFDGSLRGRQTVTKDNETKTTVVAETYYDYQGRPLIQVLPAPTMSNILNFTSNFNKFNTAAGDRQIVKSLYDSIEEGENLCNKMARKLNEKYGAANYYSPLNQLATSGFNQYIPNANGYPYTETRYTNDGTGRIDAQGGVGEKHQLASGHETKYLYKTPSQDELDALFGTDVGVNSHYFKNYVKDANGQYSISYVDMKGKTIATALSNPRPQNLKALASSPEEDERVVEELMDAETNTLVGNSIISSKPLIVTNTGNYHFKYDLKAPKLRLENCNKETICYDCYYTLKITIVPDCDGIDIGGPYSLSNKPGKGENFIYKKNCEPTTLSNPINLEFDVTIPEGSYTIIKELVLDKKAQDYFRENIFLKENICKTLEQLEKEQIDLAMEQSNCNVTCASCTTKLGSLSDYENRIKIDSKMSDADWNLFYSQHQLQIGNSYKRALLECKRICAVENGGDDGLAEVNSLKDMMLLDMTPPYGQYARPNDANLLYNIFNTANPLSQSNTIPPYLNPAKYDAASGKRTFIEYLDKNGNTATTYTKAYLKGLNDVSYFVDNFQPEYAEQLLSYHPEYCKLVETETHLVSSYQFAERLMNAKTWADALIITGGNVHNILNFDPFFNGVGISQKATMNSAINDYYYKKISNKAGNEYWINMWHMSMYSVVCRNLTNSNATNSSNSTLPNLAESQCFDNLRKDVHPAIPAGTCNADMDMIWLNFKSNYLSYRRQLISQYLNSFNNCYTGANKTLAINNADIKALTHDKAPLTPFQARFVVLDPNNNTTGDPRIDDPANSLNTQAIADNSAQQALQVCKEQAKKWLNQLLECDDLRKLDVSNDPTWDNDKKLLLQDFVSICKEGVDFPRHNFGASSLPTGVQSIKSAYATSLGDNAVRFRAFDELLAYYFTKKKIKETFGCNRYLITSPANYDKAPPLVNQYVLTKPSDCECSNINAYKQAWKNSAFAQNTFSYYLEKTNNIKVDQKILDQLIDACENKGAVNCHFFNEPIVLPAIFQCNGSAGITKNCIDCYEYKQYQKEFETTYKVTRIPIYDAQVQDDIDANKAFLSYLKYKTGFAKTLEEYEIFEKSCKGLPEITCEKLKSCALSYIKKDNESVADCQIRFTTHMNECLKTNFTFAQILQLFQQECGKGPDVCEKKIDCQEFKGYINEFYSQFKPIIFKQVDVKGLFEAFMFTKIGVYKSYNDLAEYYQSVCGCELKIDVYPNCNLLTYAYNEFKWKFAIQILENRENCKQLFIDYFNDFFDLKEENVITDFSQITDIYKNCYPECGPDINQLCNPLFNCDIIRKTIDEFNAKFKDKEFGAIDCRTAFVQFFNNKFSCNFTFNQIIQIIRLLGCEDLKVCNVEEDCVNMQIVVSLYHEELPNLSETECQEKFAQYYCNYFQIYPLIGFDEIQKRYQEKCQFVLNICKPNYPCLHIKQVYADFERVMMLIKGPHRDPCGFMLRYFNDNLVPKPSPALTMQELLAILRNCGINSPYCDFTHSYDCEQVVSIYNYYKTLVFKPAPNYDRCQLLLEVFNNELKPKPSPALTLNEVFALLRHCNIEGPYCGEALTHCDSLSHVFDDFQKPSDICNGGKEKCQALYEDWFNNHYYPKPTKWVTYNEIQQLFIDCGFEFNLCDCGISNEPYDCDALKKVYDSWFVWKATQSEFDDKTCNESFANWFNKNYIPTPSTVLSFNEIRNIYITANCPFTFNPCGIVFTSADCEEWLKPLLATFILDPEVTDCKTYFLEWFNNKNPKGLIFDSYDVLYYYITHIEGCSINFNPCNPYDCNKLQNIYNNWRNTGDECRADFTRWFNSQFKPNLTLTYDEIFNIYATSNCPIDFYPCGTVFTPDDCTLINDFIQNFVPTPGVDCKLDFVRQYNTKFGTRFGTYAEFLYYVLKIPGCDLPIDPCNNGTSSVVCERVGQLALDNSMLMPECASDKFLQPCYDNFVAVFNTTFSTSYNTYAEIMSYLASVGCKITEPCAIGSCDAFVRKANNDKGIIKNLDIPESLKQQLYLQELIDAGVISKNIIERANKNKNTHKDILHPTFDCCDYGPGDPLPKKQPITVNVSNAGQLIDFKIAYYITHKKALTAADQEAFTQLFNTTYNTSYSIDGLLEHYDNMVGFGSGYLVSQNTATKQARKILARVEGNTNMPLLCGLSEPILHEYPADTDPCKDIKRFAIIEAQEKYDLLKDSVKNIFDSAYYSRCTQVDESFTVSYTKAEYHYTLYYYNQAGNLIKTVPPAGVDDLSSYKSKRTNATVAPLTGKLAFLYDVKQARKDALVNGANTNNQLQPPHTMFTQYCYNSLGQVTTQYTPDAHQSKFWYDALGRLVVSQNAEQRLNDEYSYTLYDYIGRIKEVGQVQFGDGEAMTQEICQDQLHLKTWLASADKTTQVTKTRYDECYFDVNNDLLCNVSPAVLCQKNIRNRVSFTAVYPAIGFPGDEAISGTHTSATYYSYDIHGTVDVLLQDFGVNSNHPNAMNSTPNRFKRIEYAYDLISGKVNKVSYQPGMADQFFHKYKYDAENKITEVLTSQNGLDWDHDATYQYYKHGPLARTELGEYKVQGIDYAYTIQGWLKGVNTTATGNSSFDIGHDYAGAKKGGFYNAATDVYGYSLNYFTNDYTPIGAGTTAHTPNPFVTVSNGLPADPNDGVVTGKDLFNGNIKAMCVNIPALSAAPAGGTGTAMLYGYQYDQLNRLADMNAFTNLNSAINQFTAGGTPASTQAYKERVEYDANGNILYYLRNGDNARLRMDEFSYYYKNGNNQLTQVQDAAADCSAGVYKNYNDIKQGQTANNYSYDEIGNLTADRAEGISNIEWTLYGKIESLTKTNGTRVNYTYDAGGNRISKTVFKPAGGRSPATTTETWYVRDASGNTMSVYNSTHNDLIDEPPTLVQSEIHLYGSSRIGMLSPNTNVTNLAVYSDAFAFMRGQKSYELTNHLGNVLATVSDNKIAIYTTITDIDGSETEVLDHYEAELTYAQDYYPFGMAMPGRKIGAYRYGFNGMEKDGDIHIEVYTTEFRIFDSRLGRWFSVDPLEEDGPDFSPYCNSFNNPIILVDPNGDWPSLSDIKSSISNTVNNAKAYISEKVTATSNYVSSKYNQASAAVKTKVAEVKSYCSKKYNEAKVYAVKTCVKIKQETVATTNKVIKKVTETANKAQKWVKDNKDQIISVSKQMQEMGDVAQKTGLGLALAGAPVAGVGATPGLAVATYGTVLNTIGSVLEIATEAISGNTKDASNEIGKKLIEKTADKLIDAIVPGPTPSATQAVKEIQKAVGEIIKDRASKSVESETKKMTP